MQKSSCSLEYSISLGEKIAARISSLLRTAPPVRRASSRASVLFPVPGRPAMRMIIALDRLREVSIRTGGCGLGFRGGTHQEERLSLSPIVIAVRDHHVKAPMAALFFGLDESEIAQVEQVVLDEAHLFF